MLIPFTRGSNSTRQKLGTAALVVFLIKGLARAAIAVMAFRR